MLCDAATVREGLVNILAGGVTRLWRAALPAPLGVAVAVALEVPQDELETPHEVNVRITNDEGLVGRMMGAFQAGPQPRLEEGESAVVPFAMPLHNVGTSVHGRHVLEISVDAGAAVKTIEFWVLHPDEMQIPPIR